MPRPALLFLVLAFAPLGCGEPTEPGPPAGAPGAPEPPAAPAGQPADVVPDWAKVSDAQRAAAKEAGVTVAFENSLGMRFVLIPAGTFQMGSPPDEKGRDDNEAQHEVVLTRPYYMEITEVTNGEYRRWKPDHEREAGDRQAVWNASWRDAVAYAGWLTKTDRAGRTYRVPTEAEWERACRAGTQTRFWSGDAEVDVAKVAWMDWSMADRFPDVAAKPANPWGLCDMLGNVFEWCADWSGALQSGPVTDPQWPTSGESRVFRAGSIRCDGSWVRSASRCGGRLDTRSWEIGFRLVSLLPASR